MSGIGPPAIIEPEKVRKKDDIRGINFEMWERLYGRSLSESEKIEIKLNMVDFFTTLIEASDGCVDGHKKNKRSF